MSSRKRSRSYSPQKALDDFEDRRRSRSPRRRHPKHSHRSRNFTKPDLPHHAQPLSKRDLEGYKPLFALYLDVQKQLDAQLLSDDELKGRWKSFVGKWNHGELARGWYEPKTLEKAVRSSAEVSSVASHNDDIGEDDGYGPLMPHADTPKTQTHLIDHRRTGPATPSLHDLQARQEEAQEDEEMLRHEYQRELRNERRLDRRLQRERLDELVPRAQAGTRDRQLEKKIERANSNRVFAAAKDAGGDVELRDSDVMGDEDSLAELKQMKKEQERKKTEREIRREEVLRARTAEREERMAGRREKERKTMEMFQQIAQARFGSESGA